jgi:hypothetical protein
MCLNSTKKLIYVNYLSFIIFYNFYYKITFFFLIRAERLETRKNGRD